MVCLSLLVDQHHVVSGSGRSLVECLSVPWQIFAHLNIFVLSSGRRLCSLTDAGVWNDLGWRCFDILSYPILVDVREGTIILLEQRDLAAHHMLAKSHNFGNVLYR